MKYQGNKQRYVKYILPIMLAERKDINQYWVEPFCGSCSVLEHVQGYRIASDKNRYLIAMWKELCGGLHKHPDVPRRIERNFYNDVRDSYNKKDGRYPDYIIGWVGFMGSFNGRFFDGGYSGHDVNGRDYIGENIKNTLAQVPFLRGTEFYAENYDELLIPKQSIIYCDPPYKNTKQYATSKDFDHEKFYQWCREKKQEGHTIFVSEYEMPDDFKCVWQMDIKTAQNPHKTKLATERLFTL